MPRQLWKGALSFGLVQAPVSLYPASRRDSLGFDLLDRRTLDRVGYQRVNKETGEEVDKEDLVKGYQVGESHYVVLSDEEIRAANAQSTRMVDVVAFVDAHEVPTMFFESPYYLVPEAGGEKVYALLRETLRRTGKVGIAQVVIQTRRHLAAVMPCGPALVLNTLRWESEVLPYAGLDLPDRDAAAAGVSERELAMAEQLVDSMTRHWDPAQYHDTFRADVLALVRKKIEEGRAAEIAALPGAEEEEAAANPAQPDLAGMLNRSLGLAPERRGQRRG